MKVLSFSESSVILLNLKNSRLFLIIHPSPPAPVFSSPAKVTASITAPHLKRSLLSPPPIHA